MRKISLIFLFFILLNFCINISAGESFSITFSYDMFENYFTFGIIGDPFSGFNVYYQCFSFYFLFHHNIFIYGGQLILPFKLPLCDHHTILMPQLNFIVGIEANDTESMFFFQSGIAFGFQYVYMKIDVYNSNSNNYLYFSNYYITYDFFISIGVKINEDIIVKFIFRYTYPLEWSEYFLHKPYYCIALEYFL